MALRDEIVPYVDGEGFIAPGLVPAGQMRGSDNGPMFSSEYFVMLKKRGEDLSQDQAEFVTKLEQNIDPNGLLNRHHVGPDNGQEGPDDYYGVLSACKAYGNLHMPRAFLKAVWKYWGFLNNADPGKKTGSSFLIRQPQILACMIAAAFPSFSNPLHFVIRLLAWPLFLVAAVTLAISCVGVDTGDTDSRRLAWHVGQTTKGASLMCWLAWHLWLRRLYRDYPDGMRGVASIYYQMGHPFAKYWISE